MAERWPLQWLVQAGYKELKVPGKVTQSDQYTVEKKLLMEALLGSKDTQDNTKQAMKKQRKIGRKTAHFNGTSGNQSPRKFWCQMKLI